MNIGPQLKIGNNFQIELNLPITNSKIAVPFRIAYMIYDHSPNTDTEYCVIEYWEDKNKDGKAGRIDEFLGSSWKVFQKLQHHNGTSSIMYTPKIFKQGEKYLVRIYAKNTNGEFSADPRVKYLDSEGDGKTWKKGMVLGFLVQGFRP